METKEVLFVSALHSCSPTSSHRGGSVHYAADGQDIHDSIGFDLTSTASPKRGEITPSSDKRKGRTTQTRAVREAAMVKRTQLDEAFLKDFDPHSDWLPPNTTPYDYTPEFCSTLERKYWRNCGLVILLGTMQIPQVRF